jgi:putative endonuclease
MSQNPDGRLKTHNKGKTSSTRSRVPFVLILKETCNSRKDAREKEKYYKSGKGREILKKLDSSVAQSVERVAVNH